MTWEDDLGRLVAERGGALVAYGRLLTGDVHAAQDLVQDALVRAYSRRRTSDVEHVEAYVRQAMLHTYLDGWRRRRRLDQVVHLVGAVQQAPDTADEVGGRSDVAAALAVLSPRERACVVLRYYDDLTLPEIGHRLGVSEGAVKRYLADGRRRLAPLLGPVDDTDHDIATTSKGARR